MSTKPEFAAVLVALLLTPAWGDPEVDTVSSSGTDRMLLVRTSGSYLDVDDVQYPTTGDKVEFSGEQAIPIGASLRIPLGSLSLFETDVPFRLNFFSDYGTALGTASRVFGSPALVRDKRDRGLGYGAGIQAVTGFGLIRLEAGFADEGRSQFSLSIGDRY